MGNQLSSDTLCSRDNSGHSYWVGVDWKSFAKGDDKKCYLGCLNGTGPRSGEKVVVKAYRVEDRTRSIWKTEKLKAKTANVLLDMFKSAFPEDNIQIRINVPFPALMDTVSKMNELFGSRSRSRSLNNNDWVGIEEYIPGTFTRFCITDSKWVHERGQVIEAFSHFTYHQSRGAFVVCDFQGVFKDSSFHVTNPVIHSATRQFGAKDMGTQGINDFFKIHRCNDICRGWARMLPLSPPPAFDDVCFERRSPMTSPLEDLCIMRAGRASPNRAEHNRPDPTAPPEYSSLLSGYSAG